MNLSLSMEERAYFLGHLGPACALSGECPKVVRSFMQNYHNSLNHRALAMCYSTRLVWVSLKKAFLQLKNFT